MGASFAIGSTGFAIAPLSAYASAVGAHGDAITYFISSIFFTLGGLTQSVLAAPERDDPGEGVAAWRAAWVQSVGTLLFNVMTFAGLFVTSSSPHYDGLVWLPNMLGSLCFLISGAFLYVSSPRRGWRLRWDHPGWWEPAINMLGCVLFGISAVAATVRSGGALWSETVANWTTTFGALCFLAVGLMPLRDGHSFKAPRLRLRQLGQLVEEEVVEIEEIVRDDL